MTEVLSQSEIDALLSALNSGSVDANELKEEQSRKKVKVYEFRRPNKVFQRPDTYFTGYL